jgi:uncharacterized protein YjbI with pentapeptide repeats
MANAEHIDVLKQGKDVWNQWRQDHPEITPDLSGAELNKDFFVNPALTQQERIDLAGINFNSAHLVATSVGDADLAGADFSYAVMKEMVFSNVSLSKANLDGADLTHSKFWNSEAIGASFWDGVLENTVLSGTDLRDATFTNANMAHANLEGADLSNAELWRANLESGNLDGTKMLGANMQQCRLVKATMTRCNMKGANLYEANFSEALLDEADVRFCDLRRANLSLASVAEIEYNKESRYRGIRVSTCFGSPRFNRISNDQNYIEELRSIKWNPVGFIKNRKDLIDEKSKTSWPVGEWLYWIWWFSSDCGRSLWRWVIMALVISALFGCAFYYLLGPEHFYLSPYDNTRATWSLETMVLYSLSIFGKLSYGGVVPITHAAMWWCTTAGIAGLVVFGGLITILADKVARRA